MDSSSCDMEQDTWFRQYMDKCLPLGHSERLLLMLGGAPVVVYYAAENWGRMNEPSGLEKLIRDNLYVNTVTDNIKRKKYVQKQNSQWTFG